MPGFTTYSIWLLIRAMLHNESVYPDPFTFNPDRFMKDGKLNPAVRDPDHAAFGFGRRYLIFPGIVLRTMLN